MRSSTRSATRSSALPSSSITPRRAKPNHPTALNTLQPPSPCGLLQHPPPRSPSLLPPSPPLSSDLVGLSVNSSFEHQLQANHSLVHQPLTAPEPNATATCHNATGLVALQAEESADSSVQPLSLRALAVHLLLTLLYVLYTALCPLLGLLWWIGVSQAQVRAWVQRQGCAVREWVQRQRSALGAKLMNLRRAAASRMTLGIFPRLHNAIELCVARMRSVREALVGILKPMFGAAMLRQALERRIGSLDMQQAATRREEAERERAMEWSELRRLLDEIRDGERVMIAEVVRERDEREKVRREMHELRERLEEAMGSGGLESLLRGRLGEAMGSGALEGEEVREGGGEAMGGGALEREEGEEDGRDERMVEERKEESRRAEMKRVERRKEEKREERREERREEKRRMERKEKWKERWEEKEEERRRRRFPGG
ncbi:unnamed protein product [Closterium sp. NIES-65]|nr:unnamed protein product [Closterium sp. NIES-65]